MSSVTSIILITTIEDGARKDGEHPNVCGLNDKLREMGFDSGLAKVDCHAGGNKIMGSDIWMGAFNHLNEAEFKETFESIDWEYPDNIQLLVQNESDLKYQIFTIANA